MQYQAIIQDKEYLHEDNLHFKPLSARLFQAIQTAGTSMTQNATSNNWQGRFVRGFSIGFVAVGYVLNSLIAFAEGITTFAIALLALLAYKMSNSKSDIFQKYSVKCFAYSLNCFGASFAQLSLLFKGQFPKFHVQNALIHHIVYLSSSFIAQAVFGSMFDHLSGRGSLHYNGQTHLMMRANRIVSDYIPEAVVDILNNIDRDLRVPQMARDAQGNLNLEGFFQLYPRHVGVLQDLNIGFLQDPIQRGAILAFIGDYLRFSGVAQNAIPDEINAAGAPEINNGVLVMNRNSQVDRNYQNFLKSKVSESFLKLYNDQELVKFLSPESNLSAEEAAKAGKSALRDLDAEIFIPLANFTQLLELEIVIQCPKEEEFGPELQPNFRTRFAKLTHAKEKLEKLNEQEKIVLVKKLLNSTYDYKKDLNEEHQKMVTEANVLDVFKLVTELSNALHQGKLMNHLAMDLNNDGAMSAVNLFVEGCRDACNQLPAADFA